MSSFRRNDRPEFVIGTTAELMARTEPLAYHEVAFNTDDRSLVPGPGMYSALVAAGTVGADVVVRAVAVGKITIASGLNAGDIVDGVTLKAGDSVLLIGQSTTHQNGIYTVGASPARHADFVEYDALAGKLVFATEGGMYGGAYFLNVNSTGGTIDSTAVTFNRVYPIVVRLDARQQFSNLEQKTTLNDNDALLIEDAQAGGMKKWIALDDLKTYCNA